MGTYHLMDGTKLRMVYLGITGLAVGARRALVTVLHVTGSWTAIHTY